MARKLKIETVERCIFVRFGWVGCSRVPGIVFFVEVHPFTQTMAIGSSILPADFSLNPPGQGLSFGFAEGPPPPPLAGLMPGRRGRNGQPCPTAASAGAAGASGHGRAVRLPRDGPECRPPAEAAGQRLGLGAIPHSGLVHTSSAVNRFSRCFSPLLFGHSLVGVG